MKTLSIEQLAIVVLALLTNGLVRAEDPVFPRQPRLILKGHEELVLDAVFAPDGATLFSGDVRNTVKQWKVDSGKEINVVNGAEPPNGRALRMAISPDGSYIATEVMEKRGVVQVWEAKTGKVRFSFNEPYPKRAWAQPLAFLPDSKEFAGLSSTLTVWNLTTARPKRVIGASGDNFHFLAVSHDGKLAATAGSVILNRDSGYECVKLWQLSTGKQLGEYQGKFNTVAISPDGKLLALADPAEKEVRLIEVSKGKLRVKLEHPEGWRLVFSPDGELLVASAMDGTMKIWQVATGKELISLPGDKRCNSVRFSPDGTTLVTTNGDRILLWDVKKLIAPK